MRGKEPRERKSREIDGEEEEEEEEERQDRGEKMTVDGCLNKGIATVISCTV